MSSLHIPAVAPIRLVHILCAIQLSCLVSASAQTPNRLLPRGTAANLATFTAGFEPNRGITDARVDYIAHGPRYTLFVSASEVVLGLANSTEKPAPTQAVRMKLVGANRDARHRGQNRQAGQSNYFLGNQSRWQTDVPHYGRVEYTDVFPGITAIYHNTDHQLEYDFVVAPGADPRKIRLAFEGVKSIRIAANGDLVLDTGAGEVRQRKPV